MTLASRPRPLVRRLAFLAGNAIVCLAILFGCIVPLGGLLDGRDREIAHQRAALARLQAVASREVPPAGQETPIDDGEFLAGKADGAIAAELQARLKGIAQTAGARLRSIRGLPPKADSRSRHLGAPMEILGPIAAIQRAVHAVETAKPYLFVTGGTIRLVPAAGPAGKPQEPLIEAQLDISGVMRTEAREP